MFGIGKKKKAEGRRLTEVLTKQERNDLVAYLTSMTAIGGTEGIRDACRSILPVIQADEPLIPGVIQGLINICNTMADVMSGYPDDARQAQAIARKLNKLL